MKAKNINLDADFSHYDSRERTACEQLQAKARDLLAASPKLYEKRHSDFLLNAAAVLLGDPTRYEGIYACEKCGFLYHSDYSQNTDPGHDYCNGDTCQSESSR